MSAKVSLPFVSVGTTVAFLASCYPSCFTVCVAVDRRGQDESELRVIDLDGNKQRYRVGEVLQPLPEQGHSWHVFPQMDTDEVLLLKVFDSRRDGRTRFNAHCAVFDEHPDADPSAHRQSIEVRCLVLLNNTAQQTQRSPTPKL